MHWQLHKDGEFIASGEDGSRGKAIKTAKEFGWYPKGASISAAESLGFDWIWASLEA